MDNEYRVPKPQDAEGRIPKGPNFAEGISCAAVPMEPNLMGNWRPTDHAVGDLQLLLRFFGKSWGPA